MGLAVYAEIEYTSYLSRLTATASVAPNDIIPGELLKELTGTWQSPE